MINFLKLLLQKIIKRKIWKAQKLKTFLNSNQTKNKFYEN